MQDLEAKGIPSDDILKDYDLILIPEWVLVEINDAEGRANYLQKLIELGYPIHNIAEEDYSNLTNNEEGIFGQNKKEECRRGFYHNFGRSGFLVLSGNRDADYIFTR